MLPWCLCIPLVISRELVPTCKLSYSGCSDTVRVLCTQKSHVFGYFYLFSVGIGYYILSTCALDLVTVWGWWLFDWLIDSDSAHLTICVDEHICQNVWEWYIQRHMVVACLFHLKQQTIRTCFQRWHHPCMAQVFNIYLDQDMQKQCHEYMYFLLKTCLAKFDGKICEMLIAWANF